MDWVRVPIPHCLSATPSSEIRQHIEYLQVDDIWEIHIIEIEGDEEYASFDPIDCVRSKWFISKNKREVSSGIGDDGEHSKIMSMMVLNSLMGNNAKSKH